MRYVASKKKKKEINIRNKKGKFIGNSREKLKCITEYFKELFSGDRQKEDVIPPETMRIPFTAVEIEKASKKLKNNKSSGKDNVAPEYIKYAPQIIHQEIASILNKTAEVLKCPEAINTGILLPLPKPPKKDVRINLRPIILLSILRKILAITLIDRCWERMKPIIPLSQSAYQKGRSTTEQVFTLKILTEKCLITQNYEITILLFDMSKAFDSVDRKILLDALQEVLEPDELHLMYLMISEVKLNVRLGDELGEDILTEIGICQGDCLSALLFIYYLAKAKKEIDIKKTAAEDHVEDIHWSSLDWIIPKKNPITIDTEYADDLSFIRNHCCHINQIKRMLPSMLDEYNLKINESKTEEYDVKKGGNEE